MATSQVSMSVPLHMVAPMGPHWSTHTHMAAPVVSSQASPVTEQSMPDTQSRQPSSPTVQVSMVSTLHSVSPAMGQSSVQAGEHMALPVKS